MKRFATLASLMLLTAAHAAHAAKTDIVVLTNGDRITGEIKRLEAGLLQLSTDAMGTVNIEWRFVAELLSDQQQVLETSGGLRVVGTLAAAEEPNSIVVDTEAGAVPFERDQLVSGWPVEQGFLQRINLDVAFGFDYSKATDISNLNASVDFDAKTDERVTEATLRTDITRQPGADDQNRNVLQAAHQFLLPGRRFRSWFGAYETNEALGIDSRVSFGGVFGKYLIRTNNLNFRLAAGVNLTRESPTTGSATENAELVGNARWQYFRFASPERSLDTQLTVYPSVTESGRLRGDLRTTFKLELIEDLFWSLELYGNYDNEPLTAEAEKFDYGITTSVGWSY